MSINVCLVHMWSNGRKKKLIQCIRTQNSELRTQNYIFDLIHSYFFYNNTIQYNSVQFMIVLGFFPFGQGDSH